MVSNRSADAVLRIECSDPARAAVLLRLRADVASVREVGNQLFVKLASRDPRAVTAYIAYVLFDSGFQLYRLQPGQPFERSSAGRVSARLGWTHRGTRRQGAFVP